jgi:nucleoid-associated protein YgaU
MSLLGALAELRGDLRRAYVTRTDGKGELEVHYNPERITIAKAATWNVTPVAGAANAAEPDFGGAQPRSISLDLVLDGPSTGRDVATDAEILQSWCNPTQESRDAGSPHPPVVRLDWTGPAVFDAFLKAVNVAYVLFDRNGAPLRAEVHVEMTERPAPTPAQNPTSGSDPGLRTHVLQAGETLQSLAYGRYRDPALWRGLARFNGIHDPLRLRPGRRLELPPPAVVRELAR